MKYRIGDVEDILSSRDFSVFAHGCNTAGGFGTGIAGIVKKVFPQCKLAYHQWQENGDAVLGKAMFYVPNEHQVIANLFTQSSYGYDGNKYASYDAIDDAFALLFERFGDRNIIYPLVGAGRGGLQWNVVSEIIDHRLKGCNHHCIVRQEDIEKYDLRDKIFIV